MTNDTKASFLNYLNELRFNELKPAIAFIGTVLIIGIIGNILVLTVYALKFNKTSSTMLILTLAALDLMICTVCMPIEIIYMVYSYNFNYPTICKALKFFMFFTNIASGITLVIIAFDRYYKVCKPLKRFSIKKTKFLICLAVSLGLLEAWPAILLYGDNEFNLPDHNITTSQCAIDASLNNTKYPMIYYAFLGVIFLIQIVLLIVLYSSILRKVSTQNMAMSQRNSEYNIENTGNRKAIKTERMTVIFFALTVMFILSYLPAIILATLLSTVKDFEQFPTFAGDIAYQLFRRFYFINNAVNPIIYCFLSARFRTECWAVLKGVAYKLHCMAKPTEKIQLSSHTTAM